MPKTITKQQAAALDALNSDVKFDTRIENLRDPVTNRIVMGPDGAGPENVRKTIAMLVSRHDSKCWHRAEGPTEAAALDRAIAEAPTISRPAATSTELKETVSAQQERIAQLEADLARARNPNIHAHPGTSQVRRTPDPATPPATADDFDAIKAPEAPAEPPAEEPAAPATTTRRTRRSASGAN